MSATGTCKAAKSESVFFHLDVNKVGTLGVASASCFWSRVAAALRRISQQTWPMLVALISWSKTARAWTQPLGKTTVCLWQRGQHPLEGGGGRGGTSPNEDRREIEVHGGATTSLIHGASTAVLLDLRSKVTELF